MARSPRRVTRRDIRKPDQFVTLTGEIFNFVTRNRKAFLGAGAALAIGLLALLAWDLYAERQNRLAGRDYARAVTLYHAAKYFEAAALFGQVKQYSLSAYSSPALLYEANSYLALGEQAKAAAPLRELVQKQRKDNWLRQLALFSLAYVNEKAGDCKEAATYFTLAEKSAGPLADQAIFGKARCALARQDLKAALDSYRQYLSAYPGAERAGEAALKIQEIEARLAGAGAK